MNLIIVNNLNMSKIFVVALENTLFNLDITEELDEEMNYFFPAKHHAIKNLFDKIRNEKHKINIITYHKKESIEKYFDKHEIKVDEIYKYDNTNKILTSKSLCDLMDLIKEKESVDNVNYFDINLFNTMVLSEHGINVFTVSKNKLHNDLFSLLNIIKNKDISLISYGTLKSMVLQLIELYKKEEYIELVITNKRFINISKDDDLIFEDYGKKTYTFIYKNSIEFTIFKDDIVRYAKLYGKLYDNKKEWNGIESKLIGDKILCS
jgi:hypothetical protein